MSKEVNPVYQVIDALSPLTTADRCSDLREIIRLRPHWFAAKSVQALLHPDSLEKLARALESSEVR